MTDHVAEGPYFEDLSRGDVYDTAPPTTLTDGAAAVHSSIVGERLRLVLDHGLSRRVTGTDAVIAPPSLVWDLAIGQSTVVTHHVKANLFYRGLAFLRAPSLGDTLRTRAEVVGLRQNTARANRAPTGLVALRLTTRDQADRTVLDFWRCAMLPLRRGDVQTGRADDLAGIGKEVDDPTAAVSAWRLDPLREALPAVPREEVVPGARWQVVGGDVVSNAPELARLTLNLARTHHDEQDGARLVYGGHTIGIALSQAVRALPQIVTVVAWTSCDHTGPVHEGDTLTSTIEVEDVQPGPDSGRLVHLRSRASARSGPHTSSELRPVLDWRFMALLP